MVMEREVKLRIDDYSSLVHELKRLGAELKSRRHQVDYYLDFQDNRLKNSGNSLRIRQEGHNCYITFKGKLINDEVKSREELETNVGDCKVVFEILNRLGITNKIIVKKERESYALNDIIVEIDRVEGLGNFIEIEIADTRQLQNAKKLVNDLKIDWTPIKVGYADMLSEIRKP
ncbi:MAG: class IV adenylate cyclase [Nitrososphaeria archaeon]